MLNIDQLLESNVVPDPLIRIGIRRLLAETLREKQQPDVETQQAVAEYNPMNYVQYVNPRPVLFIVAEKDELIPPHGAVGPYNGAKAFKGTSQVAEVPYLTHFQIYSFAGFEVSSTLAADWFLKYLGTGGAE